MHAEAHWCAVVHTEGDTSYPPWDSKRRDVSAEDKSLGSSAKTCFPKIKECVVKVEIYLKTEWKSRLLQLHFFLVLHQNGTDLLCLQCSSHTFPCATTCCLSQLHRHVSNLSSWHLQELCSYGASLTTQRSRGRDEEEGPSGRTPHSGHSWGHRIFTSTWNFHLKGCVCICLYIFKVGSAYKQ